jgi:hypothetical protein
MLTFRSVFDYGRPMQFVSCAATRNAIATQGFSVDVQDRVLSTLARDGCVDAIVYCWTNARLGTWHVTGTR